MALWTPETRPTPPPPRKKSERYREQITLAEDLLSAYLPDAANAAIEIASGRAVEHLINHKTGEVHEVPVNPATRLKAVQFITERVAGKPESTKTHELGDNAAGVFQVLLGGAAQAHWKEVESPQDAQLLEADYSTVADRARG